MLVIVEGKVGSHWPYAVNMKKYHSSIYFVKHVACVNEKHYPPYTLLTLFPEGVHFVDAYLYYTPQSWEELVYFAGVDDIIYEYPKNEIDEHPMEDLPYT